MKTPNKNEPTKIEDLPKKIYPDFKPSLKEEELLSTVFQKFTTYSEVRNQSLNNFDGLNLIEYIEESYRRYTTNIDVREDIEDWQSIVHDQITRNKVNAVLSKVVAALPVAEIVPRGDEDVVKAQLVNEIYQYAEDVDDYEEFMVRFLLEGIVKGTAIGYEGHEKKSKKIRNIVSGTGDDIKIEESTKNTNRLYAEVVKLEDFYPETISVSRIKDMSRCFRRRVLTFNLFMDEFGSDYAKAQYVKPKNSFEMNQDSYPYYFDYMSATLEDGNVEVLYYYDTEADEYIITANGVWLNPLIIGEEEVVCPLPFNHKELPFFDIRFELFSSDFFYGKSLPDKLKTFQDVVNVFTNMLLDQSFLTVFQPILTNGFDSIEDDYLRPGRRTPIDTQGLPIQSAVMTLDMKTPGNWHQFILEYTKNVMEEASIDKVSQGTAGQGDRTTASEIRVAAEGVSSMLGLFGRWIKYGIKRKCLLKTKNALQFWTRKESAMIEGVLGLDSANIFNKAFSVVKMDGATLSNGKRGTKVIGLFDNREDMPTKQELSDTASVKKLSDNKDVEYIAVDSSYIRNIDFDIKLVVNQKSEQTRDMDKAIMMEKVRIYLSFFPEMVNKEELLAQLAEKLGDDPTKIISEDVLKTALGGGDKENSMKDNGMSTNPNGDIMTNSMYKSMGNQVGIQNIKQLQGNMLG